MTPDARPAKTPSTVEGTDPEFARSVAEADEHVEQFLLKVPRLRYKLTSRRVGLARHKGEGRRNELSKA